MIGACMLTAVACGAAYGGIFSHAYPGDTGVYARYGQALVEHSQIPYKDFYDEYPPGRCQCSRYPLCSGTRTTVLFKLWMAACAVGFTACSVWVVDRLGLGRLRLLPIVVAPLLLGPVFLNRYDPLPTLSSRWRSWRCSARAIARPVLYSESGSR